MDLVVPLSFLKTGEDGEVEDNGDNEGDNDEENDEEGVGANDKEEEEGTTRGAGL